MENNTPTANQTTPEYVYELNGVDDMTRKSVIYVTAKLDGKEAHALFTVDGKGNVECDASGDFCEENPFDDGWPEPSAKLIAEAKEMAVEY